MNAFSRFRPRGIDHLVLAVADLDTGAAAYERLGFRLTPRATHPFGTGNRLAQMRGSFLEVLAVVDPARVPPAAPGVFSFGAFNRDWLEGGEGLSMLVLESRDADRDLADYRAKGIAAFRRLDFERAARQPDGTERLVAFSLAITEEPGVEAGFFTCHNRFPENFWKPEFQSHPNGALDVAEVALVAEDPADHHVFLEAFTGVRGPRVTGFGLDFDTPRGTVAALSAAGFRMRYGRDPAARPGGRARLAGTTIAVADLAATAELLAAAGVATLAHAGRLVVAEPVHGTVLAFRQG